MPICVAGMHRSGTSLIARVLNASGLDLGPQADLLGAGVGNPDGHWENIHFLQINDALLEAAGGTWDRVPSLPAGWHLDPKFDSLYDRARMLVDSFTGRAVWGWKDPRNSLTLPFWLRLIPDLKVVIALRNPLDVAESLEKRNRFAAPTGVCLWADYTAALFSSTSRDQRLTTHYDAYFADFEGEAARLLAFAGLPTDALELIKDLARPNLRHNRLPLADFLDGRIQLDFVKLYLDACLEAGPAYEPLLVRELHAAFRSNPVDADWTTSRYLAEAAKRLVEGNLRARRLEEEIAALHEELRASRNETGAERDKVAELRAKLNWSRHRWADWAADRTAWMRRLGRRSGS